MFVSFILCALGFLAYSNSFCNAFHFDDYPYIVNNISIRNFHDFHHVICMEPTRVVTFFTFALNYHWGGLDVRGYHLFSLFIHVSVSVLVWVLARMLLNASIIQNELTPQSRDWTAFFTAAFFLTHPVQTQAVNYIYQRSVILAAFFYLSSLIFFIKANLAWEIAGSKTGKYFYAASLLCAVLGILSKENTVSLPLMICVYQWLFAKEYKHFHWVRVAPFFLAILILPLSWGINLHAFLRLDKTVEGLAQGLTVRQYAMTQTKVILAYLKLLMMPVHQRVEYDFMPVNSFYDASVIASLSISLLILFLGALLRHRFKLMTLGIFWFYITLMPESSFWPNADLVFEHRLYLPLFGFSMALSSGFFYFFQVKNFSAAVKMLFVVLLAYVVLTYQRNKVWRDDFTLWDNVVHESPHDSRAYLNRGAAYQIRGDLDHAMADYNMVIGLGPVTAVTLSNRGSIFRQKGDFEHALANFNLAIKINSAYVGTYFNRGLLYKEEGRLDLALADFKKATELDPNDRMFYQLWSQTNALKSASILKK